MIKCTSRRSIVKLLSYVKYFRVKSDAFQMMNTPIA